MKILAVAWNTFKESIRQPIFYIILVSSMLLIYLSPFFTFFAFWEEIKMIKDMGLATVTMATLLLALFSASSVIADEIDRKTAMTVLCKPLGREQFIIGKFFGIALSILFACLALSLIFVLTLWHIKKAPGILILGAPEVNIAGIFPGLFLIFIQAVLLGAVSTAVSTRCGLVLNLVACSFIFVLGHLSNYLVGFLEGRSALVQAIGRFFYIIIPNLENFNVSSAIALDIKVPADYILAATAYGILYSTLAIITAIFLFRKREL